MATSKILYKGNLRTQNTHLQSGSVISTDAPTDNQGKGEMFSPTDLMATSLGNCILTIMGIKAAEAKFSIDGATAEITKIMASNPRRIQEIQVTFDFSMLDLTEEQKTLLKEIPSISPAALSLHPDVKQVINFKF